MSKVTVLGSGSWGTALAQHIASNGVSVTLWGRDQEVIDEINQSHKNSAFLSGITLSENITAERDLDASIEGTSAILFCVPSHATRELVRNVVSCEVYASLPDLTPLISTAKGLEEGTNLFPSIIIEKETKSKNPVLVLSGPSFAKEIAQGLPAALVLAGKDEKAITYVHDLLHRGVVRIYSSDDPMGVELGGVLKNIIALAAGISDGLGLGHNARAALITRSIRELSQIVIAEGGQEKSLFGLAGIGDLVLTATGDMSRNRSFGLLLGGGLSAEEAVKQVGYTIEALKTAEATYQRALNLGLELPIIEQVAGVIRGEITPKDALKNLIERDPRPE